MFEAEDSNLRLKYVDNSLGRRHYVLECGLHKCVLLKDSLYWYGQVKHRESNVLWIYSVFLDVSSSSGTDVREECKV